MVEPIRFERGGPAPRFKVQRLKDLEDVQDEIDVQLKKKISLLDSLAEENKENSEPSNSTEQKHSHLQEAEAKIVQLMSSFQAMVSGCELSQTMSDEDQVVAKEKLLDIKDHSEFLKQIATRKIALARAKILTKAFWTEKREISVELTPESRERLETFFKTGVFTKNAAFFQTSLHALNQSLESTKGLSGDLLYEAMINKGEILNAKEELITAFIEYKRTVSLRYVELTGKDATNDDLCPSIRKRLIEGFSKIQGDKDFVDNISAVVMSNRYSDPASLVKDSIGLATIETSTKNAHLSHNLSISSASLALGFSLPVALLSSLQLIRNRARRRKIAEGIREAKHIQTVGDLMFREGQIVRQMTSRMLTEKIEGPKDLEKLGVLIKQADRLTSLGIELKEKALLTEQELKQQLATIDFTIFNGVISTPLNLAGLASSSLSIAAKFIQNPAVKYGLQTMHFVGMASGAIGLVLGGVGIIRKSQEIHKTRTKLKELDIKGQALIALEKEFGKDPLVKAFCDMEKTNLLNERDALKVTLRNFWIELANSILLTIGGAIAFAAFITGAAATGGLSIAVFAIIGVSTIIVIAHWAKKKDWEIEKTPIDPNKIINMQGDLVAIGKYLKIEKEKIQRFSINPKAILEHHFKEKKAL